MRGRGILLLLLASCSSRYGFERSAPGGGGGSDRALAGSGDEGGPNADTAGDLAAGWQPHVAALEAMSRARGKPILFTEVGYRSIAGAAIEPWNWRIQRPVDEEEQADAYEALFSVFWQRPWFAGLFLWDWDPVGSFDDADGYSPKLKPAAEVMAQWFIRGAEQPL